MNDESNGIIKNVWDDVVYDIETQVRFWPKEWKEKLAKELVYWIERYLYSDGQ